MILRRVDLRIVMVRPFRKPHEMHRVFSAPLATLYEGIAMLLEAFTFLSFRKTLPAYPTVARGYNGSAARNCLALCGIADYRFDCVRAIAEFLQHPASASTNLRRRGGFSLFHAGDKERAVHRLEVTGAGMVHLEECLRGPHLGIVHDVVEFGQR